MSSLLAQCSGGRGREVKESRRHYALLLENARGREGEKRRLPGNAAGTPEGTRPRSATAPACLAVFRCSRTPRFPAPESLSRLSLFPDLSGALTGLRRPTAMRKGKLVFPEGQDWQSSGHRISRYGVRWRRRRGRTQPFCLERTNLFAGG